MISNNTSYKLKASKSSREVTDYDNNQSDDNYENSSVDGDVEANPKYVYVRDGRFRGSGRPRSSEFRASRANDRRGGFRGRGGLASRRGDRDSTDSYALNRKYQESLSRHSESSGTYHGKFYEPEKKSDIKLNLPEDTRISKLLRRLSTETDQENSLTISKKLLEVLLLPDNAQYVRKAFHILGESMYEILQVSPGPLAKLQAARALGRMGYIMGQENDFERYQNWLFVKMKNSHDEMQILLMKSFKETLAFEKMKPVLQDNAASLMHNLVGSIEITENAEVFKIILDILITTVELYSNCFHNQFQDTVDLLFGWHVDHTQPFSTIEFISRNLQRISFHFKINLDFSISLIENFLEDIALNQLNDSESSTLEHVTVYILALNTVLKCLNDIFNPTTIKNVSMDLVSTCLNQIIKIALEALEKFIPADNLIIAANESIGILLGHLDSKPQALSSSIYSLIDLEMSHVSDFCDATIVSMLLLISKIIKELSANLPVELIEKLIGPKSEIIKLRSSHFKNIQNAVICVYQALLNLKNVSLLQEAYRYVLGDLEMAYKSMVPEIRPFIQNNPFIAEDSHISGTDQQELRILFLLRCLSQLANASSIIVMWALKPSILELVGVNLEPYREQIAQNNPALQYSLLYLLYSHCKCYNHFISSSSLVAKKHDQNNHLMGLFNLSEGLNMDDVPNTSPNLGNFAIILDILHKTLSIKTTTTDVILLLLQWFNDILTHADSYLANLYDNEQFNVVTQVVVKCGYHFNGKIVLAVCDALTKLLGNNHLPWDRQFLVNVCDLCKLHLNSNCTEIRSYYAELAADIPWDIAIVEFNKSHSIYDIKKKSTNIKDYNNYMVWMAQHLHLNSSTTGDIYPLQFKIFMDYLLKNDYVENNWLEDIFISSWPLQAKTMDFFYDLALNSRIVLNNWATLESAQFCVNSKLRTPLGKPNETFTKIECALNRLGNDLINVKKSNDATSAITTTNDDSNRVRLLLQFIEHLEKALYNASEGCAMAMQQPPKQVRSFFITNTNTCMEWLSRIRMVCIHIAMHAGDPSTAIRHGHALLADLIASCRTSGVEFERVVMFVTLALLTMRETEALQGLYVWCKNATGRNFPWIKSAAEQASRRYEIAIDGYRKILKKTAEQNGKLEADIQHFIYDQIVICYKELGNFVDLMNWSAEENPNETENGGRYWFAITDWNCVNNLFNVEVGRQAFTDLSTWNYKNESDSWSMFDQLTMAETNLYGIAFNNTFIDKTDDNLMKIQKSIRDNLNLAPSDYLQQLIIMQYAINGIKHYQNNTTAENSVFLVSENFEQEIGKIDSSILRKMLWWGEYFKSHHYCPTFQSNLRLEVIKRARKEKNFKLAFTHVNKFLHDKQLLVEENGFNTMAAFFLQKLSDVPVWTTDTAMAMTEIIKLSYCSDADRQNTFNLCAATTTAISKYAERCGSSDLKKISSRILLKLANWLQINDEVCLTEINSPLGKLLMVLPEIGMCENDSASMTSVIPTTEIAIGKLLQFSVHQCVGLAKSWNSFGTWCYRWGRKIVDHCLDVHNNLSEEDCIRIKNLLSSDTSQQDFDKIVMILSQTRSTIDEEDIELNDINTSEMIQNQLKYVVPTASEQELQDLVQIWRNTQKRIYTYYALSAEAYFKYLHLTTNSENITKNTECNVITVTLRLLRLIVKYALELQSILEEGLQTTPTQPWKVIIPQLFSRLNHPESYVRHRVSDLLCRIAQDAPHLITFPAVVGALEGGLKFDFSEITLPRDCLSQNNECNNDELNEEEDNYDSDNEEDTMNALQSCFKLMVDTLSKQDPETIAQVQMLVKELRRITLLWDELWLGTLAQHQTEIGKRQQQLECEIEKVNENPNLNKEEKMSLIAEKHRIIIKPIVFVLEQLKEVTSVEAETPHEKQFQEKYLDEINQVINKLKNPENPDKPSESLLPLKTLQKQFQQKFHRRASYTLKMQSISPLLSAMKNTVIAMPGLMTTSSKTRVTISHVSNVVSILPTKTKPKKLIFYGSDGQTYTYLFKGLEDLHLDERIMQFLSIANTMMAHNNADLTDQNLYRARHYSVIPLGPRSGLISWVDGTTPVFALYKRWQQREIAKPNVKNNTNTATAILRPSEMFYNKLNPLLKEHGVKNIENRKEWPTSVLKQVLKELMLETPNDLLAKELWCNAISASAWWQVIKRYSYSVAVMSIIGYIIGLGDRHLDNVLVDLTSGEVVHIDYNVCFEKGKTLRVPEKVPFRLTPNMRKALGVTGVEGIFRMACENVLKTMRKGRETLLTLLEAFVYDPLIDWTVGGEVLAGTTFGGITTSISSKQSKKDLEKEVTLSMFNVRCTELKVDWNDNKDDILNGIPLLLEKFNSWLDIHKKIKEAEDYLQDLHQQMALVKEAEAHGANKQHPLYHLPSRYEIYCKTQDAMKTAKKDLDKIIVDAETHISMYLDALKLLDSQQFTQWITDLTVTNSNSNDMNIFDLVKEFLHNAGKNDVISQCEQSENDVEQLSHLQNLSIRRCLQLLQEYNVILTQCPRSYIENHRMCLFLKWSKYMLDAKTVDSCDVVYEKFRNFLDLNNSKHALQISYTLEAFCKETMSQVNKLYEDLTTMRSQESNSTLETLYTNARLGVSTFLNSEKAATNAFEFVIANELVLLNKNLLTLETTASRSGDLLIKWTSRDGDWFLDELVVNSTRVVEMINNLPLKPNEDDVQFLKVLNGIRIANNLYKGLHELHFNFHTIILPESMKKIHSEETTVLQIVADLGNLIVGLGTTIPDMISQLEKILSCLFMQMEINSSYEAILEQVASTRVQFQALVQTHTDAVLSPGKMLIMGFNGLFEKLSQEMHSLVNVLGNLEVPTSWKKLDQVKEAKNIAAHIFNPKVHQILEDIFLLKRMQAMSEFFGLTLEMCQSFKGGHNGKQNIYNDEQLVKPIRQFIADFISRQLLGITTEAVAYAVCFLLDHLSLDVSHEIEQKDIGAESKVPLDELCHKAWNYFLKQGVFTQNLVSQASSFSANLKTAWEKIQEPKKIELKLTVLQSSALRIQNQLTVYNFMYEEVLAQIHAYNYTVRNKFIVDLKNEMTTLSAVHSKLIEARERQQILIENAYQRLNWAKGANPNVIEISAAFESAVSARDVRYNLEQTIGNDVLAASKIILQHELLRTLSSNESKSYDKLFLNGFEKWRIACQYTSSKSEAIMSSIEESIMNLLNAEMLQDPKWLQRISEIISDLITTQQRKFDDDKSTLLFLTDDLNTNLEKFKNTYNVHVKLMADVKSLIKSMTKIEDYSAQTQQFVTEYRQYIESFSSVFSRFKKDNNVDDIKLCLQCLIYVQETTNRIYESLLNLEARRNRPQLTRQDCTILSPFNKGQLQQAPQKQESITKGQQRNAYAVSVWRRVKMKLEGRDPDPGRKYTSQEQVDYVIREATNLDNLALLYEGWTPWV